MTLMHDGSGKSDNSGTWGSLKASLIERIGQFTHRRLVSHAYPQNGHPVNAIHEFSKSCRVIGRWVSRDSNQPASRAANTVSPSHAGSITGETPAAHAKGNNNLLEYTLHWEAAPPVPQGSLYKTTTGGSVGFEHYLNCLHRDDVQAELRSIRSQMLNRQASCISRLRMRIDNTGWTCVEVRRDMTFASDNGELTGFTLTVAIDLSQSVSAE